MTTACGDGVGATVTVTSTAKANTTIITTFSNGSICRRLEVWNDK